MHGVIKAGVIVGTAAGIVSAIFATAISLATAEDIWVGAKAAGYAFYGDRTLLPGFELDLIIVGVLTHFAVSIGWSIPFVLLFWGLSPRATLIAGILWGLGVWIVMFYIVLPLVGAAKVAAMTPVGRAIVEHLFFGIAVATGFVGFQRSQATAMRAFSRAV